MTWIGGKLLKWSFGGTETVLLEEPPQEEPLSTTHTPLVMLAPDASGLASFQFYSFGDTDVAIQFIQRSFGNRSDTGLIAFWAMTQKPAISLEPGADNKVEAIVMVRDGLRPEVVYPFSFVDITTAQTFVQYEMKRGIDPNHVLVYWAVPVQLGITNDGDLRLFPDHPPAVEPDDFGAVHSLPEPGPGSEAWAGADIFQPGPPAPDSAEVFVSTEDDPIEALFVSPVGSVEQASTQLLEGSGEPTVGLSDDSTETEKGDSMKMQQSVVEMDVVEPEVDVAEPEVAGVGPAAEPLREPEANDAASAPKDDPKGKSTNGARPRSASHRQTTRIEIRTTKTIEVNTTRTFGRREDGVEPAPEMRRVLSVRRWEEHTEPFTGFQSPPGRF